jgi:predicted GH43/DUF377 family glycosyl hydrolase
MLRCYSIFLLQLLVYKSHALTYTVDVKRYSAFPIISKTLGAGNDFYHSAALYIDENNNIGAILPGKNAGETNSAFFHSTITFKNGIPVATQPSNNPVFNISNIMENPIITKYNDIYYVLFSNNININVAVTSDPKDPKVWINGGIVTPNENAIYGAPLFATAENGLQQNYLLTSLWASKYVYGGTAPLQDLSVWKYPNGSVFESVYPFDNDKLQTGNPPLQLKTGDFFHVYNGCDGPTWSLGYVILDKINPFSVIQRSNISILSPMLDWEIGNSTSYLGQNVVFLNGLIHDTNNCPEENAWTQCFFGLYGGAASHIGAIKIIVSWQ